MAETVTANFRAGLGTVCGLNGTYFSGSVTDQGLDETITLTGTTTPAATKRSSGTVALSSGSATLSLESLPGLTGDETVTFAGLKLQLAKFKNPSTNANKIVISQGGSNPYLLDGATTTWSIPLAPGQSITLNLDGASSTVSGTALNIAIAGTGSQALSFELVAG